ncbi:hypothetical protein NP284_35395 [Rhodopseudomonas pseudopalustris]|uniref:Uncharacterized protein n=1 Tax=Rhodopseudomonas pseudopalustris TaxID=1513892 RepID=A0A1H8T930_9BRAD|nr:hypothetical protein [Rhodopseudomonas pseudopalustris]SEO87437.1 hypothetical protein SAMN05444123_105285 [Rhodopseudomonas pseudopalustris]
MHSRTIEFRRRPRAIAGPQNAVTVHDHPDQVLRDDALCAAEKRAILSSWASDANAVEHQPWLRSLPGSGRTVPLASILAALRRLDDDDDPPPKGGAAIRLSGFSRGTDGDVTFERFRPMGRKYYGLGKRQIDVRSRALPGLRRDHATREGRAAAGRT